MKNVMSMNTQGYHETIFPKGDKRLPTSASKSFGIGNVVFEPGCRNSWHISTRRLQHLSRGLPLQWAPGNPDDPIHRNRDLKKNQ